MKIALLPMDDRPVNYDYPCYLARMAGCELLMPERLWLGNPWRPSQHSRLVDWLQQAGEQADGLILSIDTLAYGGLIPSRTSPEPLPKVMQRLEVLRSLKRLRPSLPVLASSVIQRISRHNSSEEEKDYWATYGSRMFRLSFLEHRIELGEAGPDEKNEAGRLRKEIPDAVYQDYRQGRDRNHAVNRAMLAWLGEGVFDYLILPQDDTADYGWNIAEARSLQREIRRQGLGERAISYPGADEIGSLLLASLICRQNDYRLKVWPRYSSVLSPQVTTSYEDRPIHELIKAHLAPLNGSLAHTPREAGLILYVNAPAHQQGEGLYQWLAWQGLETLRQDAPDPVCAFLDEAAADPVYHATRRELESPQRSPEEFTRALLADLHAGRNLALADVAYVNGADLVLGNLLLTHSEVARLSAFGGWNTAGNTLGTVLAQAALSHFACQPGASPEQLRAHLEFLFLRYLDDFYYQARERTLALLADLPALGLPLTGEHLASPEQAAHLDACVRLRLERSAQELENLFIQSGLVQSVQAENIHLPWQRLFEVGFDVHVRLAGE